MYRFVYRLENVKEKLNNVYVGPFNSYRFPSGDINSTPQNEEFEMAVEVDNKAMVEPVFGIVVRQCDIPEGCNVHVDREKVTISFDRKYYPVKTEEGYAVVMQAIRLLAEAKNIEK